MHDYIVPHSLVELNYIENFKNQIQGANTDSSPGYCNFYHILFIYLFILKFRHQTHSSPGYKIRAHGTK